MPLFSSQILFFIPLLKIRVSRLGLAVQYRWVLWPEHGLALKDAVRNPGPGQGLRSGSTWDLWAGSLAKVQWLLSPQVLGSIFFAIACFLYKSPLGSSDGLEASLPSQSSASDNPSDLQEAPSALRMQSNI